MSGPTPDQIKTVQGNLQHMQKLNDYIFNHGQAKILHAYLLMSEKDDTDPGLGSVLNLLAAALGGLSAGFGGEFGNIVGGFGAGLVNYWTTNTPPNLNGVFASYISRFSETSVTFDETLATYAQDVPGNWNTSFQFQGKSYTLSDLATGDVPPEDDPNFEEAAKAALLTLDKSLWADMLKSKFNILFFDVIGNPEIISGEKSDPPVQWAKNFYKKYHAQYINWKWHDKLACNDRSGWEINQWGLGTGSDALSYTALSKDACVYLFQDSIDGTIINENGLYPRETVFFKLGIKIIYPRGLGGTRASDTLSVGYLRAMKQERTLTHLINQIGREELERRVIDRAKNDALFAHDLARRPRQTLEEFLEIRIPETVAVNVILESPSSFGLVVPMDED